MNSQISRPLVIAALLALVGITTPARDALAQKPSRVAEQHVNDEARMVPADKRPAEARQEGRSNPQQVNRGNQGAGRASTRSGDRSRNDPPDRDEHRDNSHASRDGGRTTTIQPNWNGSSDDRHDHYPATGYSRSYPQTRYVYPPRHGYPVRRYHYPPGGYVARALPHNVVKVRYRDYYYWYGGGVWYRPYGPRYIVVSPPLGVYVPVLPGFYGTYWYGGIPYYYTNSAYYLWRERERAYEVVAAPPGADSVALEPVVEDIFVYPRLGQSDEQVATDRYECHRWAADATGFDPTQPGGGVASGQADSLREAYLRAMTVCLEGRGYSVG